MHPDRIVQGLSWNVRSRSADLQIYPMKPKASLPCSNRPALVPILNQLNWLKNFTHYDSKIHFNIILQCMSSLRNGVFPWGFPTKTVHAFIISLMRVTTYVHLIHLDLMTL
jgi:hypothetical protein